MTELNDLMGVLDNTRDAPDFMWDKWKRLVDEHAPDLADMLGVGS